MRLIDADKLIEGRVENDSVRIATMAEPTVDAIEVVRCKDCIYYEKGKDYQPYCNCFDGGISDYPQEDDFCSYGERRED